MNIDKRLKRVQRELAEIALKQMEVSNLSDKDKKLWQAMALAAHDLENTIVDIDRAKLSWPKHISKNDIKQLRKLLGKIWGSEVWHDMGVFGLGTGYR